MAIIDPSQDDIGSGPALPAAWRSAFYVVLHLTGFAATTLLLTWGLFALFFIALGGFSFGGLVGQLNNLTERYIAASPDRTASFQSIFTLAHLFLSASIVVLRRGHLRPAAQQPGEAGHG
jgi:hypothetical protein